MFVSAFVEEMYFVGGGDGDGGVDRHVGYSYSDDPFVVVLEVLDLCLREEAHNK